MSVYANFLIVNLRNTVKERIQVAETQSSGKNKNQPVRLLRMDVLIEGTDQLVKSTQTMYEKQNASIELLQEHSSRKGTYILSCMCRMAKIEENKKIYQRITKLITSYSRPANIISNHPSRSTEKKCKGVSEHASNHKRKTNETKTKSVGHSTISLLIDDTYRLNASKFMQQENYHSATIIHKTEENSISNNSFLHVSGRWYLQKKLTHCIVHPGHQHRSTHTNNKRALGNRSQSSCFRKIVLTACHLQSTQ
eukprot:540613-Hanusia_phi.AAC.1